MEIFLPHLIVECMQQNKLNGLKRQYEWKGLTLLKNFVKNPKELTFKNILVFAGLGALDLID